MGFINSELCGFTLNLNNPFNVITFEQFFEYCDNWEYNSPFVKLNDTYNAEIKAKGIQVGCQFISFDAVKELYKRIENIQK